MSDLPASTHFIIDYRERNSKTVAVLEGTPHVTLQFKALSAGDYLIENHLLIERKTLIDFAVSLKDGRFFSQLKRLASAPVPAALLLEGVTKTLRGCGVSRQALQGALVHCAFVWGVPVLRAWDAEESVRIMLFTTACHIYRRTPTLPRWGTYPAASKQRRLYMLQGLPHIGPVRAFRLLQHFKTVRAVLNAGVEELQKVAGIGPALAREIKKILDE
ncbi:nuclease [candidate division KSB1 bacterium]|nr:nuclease [candidate division KSB1 bacterium]